MSVVIIFPFFSVLLCIYICGDIYVDCMYLLVHVYLYTFTYIISISLSLYIFLYIYVYVCIYVYMSNPFILISLHSYRCLFSPCSSSSCSPCPRLSPSPPWLGPSVPQEKGADLEAKDRWSNTALILASEKGHTETAKFLVVGGEGGGTGGRSGV